MKRIGALGLVLLGALGACSSDPGAEDFVESLAAARPDMSESEVRCVVAELRETYSDVTLTSLISDAGTVDDEAAAAFASTQYEALRTCDVEDQVAPSLVASFAEVNGVSEETAGCAVGHLQQQYGFWELTDRLIEEDDSIQFQRRQFEVMFTCGDRTAIADQLRPQLIDQGVDPADAGCVASEIADRMVIEDLAVLYSGVMTEQFGQLFFGALDACGALRDS